MQIKTSKWHTLHTLKSYHGNIDNLIEKYDMVIQDQKKQEESIKILIESDNRIFSIYPDRPSEWYPMGFDFEFREYIRDKFNRKCFLCGISEKDCDTRLAVHHIDYDKSSLDLNNFVPLCKSCHGKTSSNRAYWKEVINNKLFLLWLGFSYEVSNIKV